MKLEDAEYILNEMVIDSPSIKSNVYISAEEMNEAIQTVSLELEKKNMELSKLKKIIMQKDKLIFKILSNNSSGPNRYYMPNKKIWVS